jgi:chemotaxis protein histidine kinase CheA
LGDSFDLGSLIEEFREEAREQVDRLDHGLLQLDREGELDQDARGHLMRSLHTLKGNAGMLGLGPIRDFVHVVETVLKGPSGEAAAGPVRQA